MAAQGYRFIRRPEVEAMTGLSRSTIYELLARDSGFPKPVRLSGESGRLRVWLADEVEEWLAARVAERVAA